MMMKAHTDGRAVVYTGTREVAELKADQIGTFHEVRDQDGRDLPARLAVRSSRRRGMM